MLGVFAQSVFWIAVVLLVGATPLWIVALWRKQWAAAKGMAMLAGVIALAFGGISIAVESSVDACEASGGIGCANAYMGPAFLLFFVGGAFVLVALGAAIMLGFRTSKDKRVDPGAVLWCESCNDLVSVNGHASTHTLRPMRTT
jgi:hypothetical protein